MKVVTNASSDVEFLGSSVVVLVVVLGISESFSIIRTTDSVARLTEVVFVLTGTLTSVVGLKMTSVVGPKLILVILGRIVIATVEVEIRSVKRIEGLFVEDWVSVVIDVLVGRIEEDKLAMGVDKLELGIDKLAVGIDKLAVRVDKLAVGVDKLATRVDDSVVRALVVLAEVAGSTKRVDNAVVRN